MIQKTTPVRWVTSSGEEFKELSEAQLYELRSLLAVKHQNDVAPVAASIVTDDVLEALVAQKDRVVDILTTQPNSRPKARRINKRPKVEPLPKTIPA